MQSNGKKIAILLILAVLVVGAAYVLSRQGKDTGEGTETTEDKIVTNQIDLSKATNNEDKLPPGMPQDIPVEFNNFTQSYSSDYVNRGVVQNTISYRSEKSPAEKYQEYLSYMTEAGYDFGEQGRNEANTFLYGSKNNDDLSVVISREPTGSTLVQVNYLDRE